MLKPLEKLVCAIVTDGVGDGNKIADGEELASQIQSDIDRYYFPRLKYNDGKPVQFGDRVINYEKCSFSIVVDEFRYKSDGSIVIVGKDGIKFDYEPGEYVRFYPVPEEKPKDTQSSIISDAYDLEERISEAAGDESDFLDDILDLLKRQRKLSEQKEG